MFCRGARHDLGERNVGRSSIFRNLNDTFDDMKTLKTLYVADRRAWRAWLKKNHAKETEVWLIYFKKHTGRPRVPYDDAVEEALCFGWIDSTVRRLDAESFAQRFTPRRDSGNWSESNRKRLRKLIGEGRMTKAGLDKVDARVLDSLDEKAPAVTKKAEPVMPPQLEKALRAHGAAWENFRNLAPSYRREYVTWVSEAKKEETRERRIREAVELLSLNKRLSAKWFREP